MSLNRRDFLSLSGAGMASLFLHRAIAANLVSAPSKSLLSDLPRGDQRIALISDLNSSYGSTSYVSQVHRGLELLIKLQPDLVLCAGDMVAGQKLGLTSNQLDAMWSAFDEQILQPLRTVEESFAPTMGNHDASNSRAHSGYVFELDRLHAQKFWRARQGSLGLTFVDAHQFPFRYSIRHGEIFLLVVDASSANISADDWAWAEIQLDGSEARQAKLRMMMGHLPPYAISKGRDRAGEVLHEPKRLQQLIQRKNVDLYISGHHHAWYPSHVGSANLLSLGCMGSGPRQRLNDRTPPQQTITLLDLFSQQGELVETTIELDGLQVLPEQLLPSSLQPSVGPRLDLRSTRINLNNKSTANNTKHSVKT